MAALKNLVGGAYVEAINCAMAHQPAAQALLGDGAAFVLASNNGYFNHHLQASASAFGKYT